jgi:hypothetical protein
MSKFKRLVKSYGKYIAIPWRADAAVAQRVVFCVYNESDELRLRSKIDEFEIVTRQSGHNWALFDLTDSFAQWLTSQKYVRSYFKKPNLLATLYPKYLEYIIVSFDQFLEQHKADETYVVAIKGVGSLFGFLKVKEVVEKLAPLAVPITADKDI